MLPIRLRYNFRRINSAGLYVVIFCKFIFVISNKLASICAANGKRTSIRVIVLIKGKARCALNSSRCRDKGLLISLVSDNRGVSSGA